MFCICFLLKNFARNCVTHLSSFLGGHQLHNSQCGSLLENQRVCGREREERKREIDKRKNQQRNVVRRRRRGDVIVIVIIESYLNSTHTYTPIERQTSTRTRTRTQVVQYTYRAWVPIQPGKERR